MDESSGSASETYVTSFVTTWPLDLFIIWPVECCDVDMPVIRPLVVLMCSIESLAAGQIRVMLVQIHRTHC